MPANDVEINITYEDSTETSAAPTTEPSGQPSTPTQVPSTEPSGQPSTPTQVPSTEPSDQPVTPTQVPSTEPSGQPVTPTQVPSTEPSDQPVTPTQVPSTEPSGQPVTPTQVPSTEPSDQPVTPTQVPSTEPSDQPAEPTQVPSSEPSDQPETSTEPATVYTVDVSNAQVLNGKDLKVQVDGKDATEVAEGQTLALSVTPNYDTYTTTYYEISYTAIVPDGDQGATKEETQYLIRKNYEDGNAEVEINLGDKTVKDNKISLKVICILPVDAALTTADQLPADTEIVWAFGKGADGTTDGFKAVYSQGTGRCAARLDDTTGDYIAEIDTTGSNSKLDNTKRTDTLIQFNINSKIIVPAPAGSTVTANVQSSNNKTTTFTLGDQETTANGSTATDITYEAKGTDNGKVTLTATTGDGYITSIKVKTPVAPAALESIPDKETAPKAVKEALTKFDSTFFEDTEENGVQSFGAPVFEEAEEGVVKVTGSLTETTVDSGFSAEESTGHFLPFAVENLGKDSVVYIQSSKAGSGTVTGDTIPGTASLASEDSGKYYRKFTSESFDVAPTGDNHNGMMLCLVRVDAFGENKFDVLVFENGEGPESTYTKTTFDCSKAVKVDPVESGAPSTEPSNEPTAEPKPTAQANATRSKEMNSAHIKNYELTTEAGTAGDAGYTVVKVKGTVEKHLNGASNEGYWYGVGIDAPAGKQFKKFYSNTTKPDDPKSVYDNGTKDVTDTPETYNYWDDLDKYTAPIYLVLFYESAEDYELFKLDMTELKKSASGSTSEDEVEVSGTITVNKYNGDSKKDSYNLTSSDINVVLKPTGAEGDVRATVTGTEGSEFKYTANVKKSQAYTIEVTDTDSNTYVVSAGKDVEATTEAKSDQNITVDKTYTAKVTINATENAITALNTATKTTLYLVPSRETFTTAEVNVSELTGGEDKEIVIHNFKPVDIGGSGNSWTQIYIATETAAAGTSSVTFEPAIIKTKDSCREQGLQGEANPTISFNKIDMYVGAESLDFDAQSKTQTSVEPGTESTTYKAEISNENTDVTDIKYSVEPKTGGSGVSIDATSGVLKVEANADAGQYAIKAAADGQEATMNIEVKGYGISGTYAVGETLTATTYGGASEGSTFEWSTSDDPSGEPATKIDGQETKSLTLAEAQTGSYIVLKVDGTSTVVSKEKVYKLKTALWDVAKHDTDTSSLKKDSTLTFNGDGTSAITATIRTVNDVNFKVDKPVTNYSGFTFMGNDYSNQSDYEYPKGLGSRVKLTSGAFAEDSGKDNSHNLGSYIELEPTQDGELLVLVRGGETRTFSIATYNEGTSKWDSTATLLKLPGSDSNKFILGSNEDDPYKLEKGKKYALYISGWGNGIFCALNFSYKDYTKAE